MPSPKQPTNSAQRDWYPYYAGYTEDFVHGILASHLSGVQSVLDPWSGTGTTGAACAQNGIASTGVDLNPALTVIARARITPQATADSLLPLGRKILDFARSISLEPQSDDLLSRWMQPGAAVKVRAIQHAIHTLLTESPSPVERSAINSWTDSLPVLACFFYSSLFAAIRDLFSRFSTTNPMWLLEPATPKHRISPTWQTLSRCFLERIVYLRDRLSLQELDSATPRIKFLTGSATTLPLEPRSFDAALTSPPYATRLDYVKGLLPELCVLGVDSSFLRILRAQITGTPVVTGTPAVSAEAILSSYGRRIISAIAEHPTKGSKHYYAPWMARYLLGLQRGLRETARTVAPSGPIGIVVQDSYYKAEHIDLQRFVVETMEHSRRALVACREYPATRLRSRMNPRATRHLRQRRNIESLLVFT